jgi:hypothetical protein
VALFKGIDAFSWKFYMRETRFRMISSLIPDAGMAHATLTGFSKLILAPCMEFLGQEEGTHGLPLS